MKYINRYNESKKKFPNIKKIDINNFIFYLGKDAKSNDYLTFNMADDDDIWFHVKGYPGSHGVLKIKGQLPMKETLKEAAKLVKKNSKASNLDSATVVYCKKKFVTKQKGLRDGQVNVDYKNSYKIIIKNGE